MSTQTIPNTLVPAVITDGRGKGLTTTKILWNSNTGRYHCSECNYTNPKFAGARGHRSKHGAPRKVKRQATPSLNDRVASVLADLQAVIEELGAAAAHTENGKVDASWKHRAQTAERRLATLRRALGTDE